MYSEKTDEELVAMTIENQDCFLYLVNRYEKKLNRYIKRILNINNETVEDVLQEVFIKIYRYLNSFDQDLKFSSWAYRIAHNESMNQLKKIKKAQSVPIESDEEMGNLIEVLQSEVDLHADHIRKELKEAVHQGLQKIPFKYREILILHYIEDKSYREIGDILKKPIGTVATLINRAKAQLKLSLNDTHLFNQIK